jgi:hypothetical protein
MFTTQAKCQCRTLVLDVVLNQQPESIIPRKCDCDFCLEKNLVYLSDSTGSIQLSKGKKEDFYIIKQGSESANFLACKKCNDILLVTLETDDNVYAAINYQLLDKTQSYAEVISVSPKTLNPEEKKSRWQQVWFNDVRLN